MLGESKDYDGKDNPIMKQITRHKGELETEIGVPVYLEPEFMTSSQAERLGSQPFPYPIMIAMNTPA